MYIYIDIYVFFASLMHTIYYSFDNEGLTTLSIYL